MNSPEETIFDSKRFPSDRCCNFPSNDEFRLMHHGSIVHRHGVDILVKAVAKLYPKLPNIRLDIYGSNTHFCEFVIKTAQELGIGHCVRIHGVKTQSEIAQAIQMCHVGIVPNRRSAFTELNLPTRLFEYLALGRPVIAPVTQGICDYFNQKQIIMFEPDNVDDLAEKILWIWSQPTATQEIVERGMEVYRRHLWRGEKLHFLQRVAALLQKCRPNTLN